MKEGRKIEREEARKERGIEGGKGAFLCLCKPFLTNILA